jgi:ufm1-conjugating enzyme 1
MSIDKALVQKIPLLTASAGPRDTEWIQRLEQEYAALIKVGEIYLISHCISSCNSTRSKIMTGSELSPTKTEQGRSNSANRNTFRWFGKCWFVHNYEKYEFTVQFDVHCVNFFSSQSDTSSLSHNRP